jgi:signal transduction histidine kinase
VHGGVETAPREKRSGRPSITSRPAKTPRLQGAISPPVARLFQPFTQVHERAEVKERGTGLGLSISRGIAETHGGRIGVESGGRGQGSTFTVALPGTTASSSP